MSNATSPTPAPVGRPSLEEWMRQRHHVLSLGLLALAPLCAALPVWHLIQTFREIPGNTPLALWGGFLTLVFLFGGLYLRFSDPAGAQQPNYRLLALTLGGLVGLGTFLFGLLLPFMAWSVYFVPGPISPESLDKTATPVLTLWRTNWWRLAVTGAAVVGGLVLMLISVQLARSVERASAGMRRLLYGYNAVLTGVLLFAVLGLLNILAYVPLSPFTLFNKQIDLTPSQMYTLAPRSEKLLETELPGSIEIIALMPEELLVTEELRQLYTNCKRHKKDMTFQVISRTRDTQKQFSDEFNKYRRYFEGELPPHLVVRGAVGMVVIYNRPDGTKDIVGVPFSDLSQQVAPSPHDRDRDGPPSNRQVFAGENQLMRALRKSVDKTKAKIVFTKGHGELSLSDMDPESLKGLGVLRQRLEKAGNYEIKEVDLSAAGFKAGELADAEVVVVAQPRKPFLEEEARKALTDYLNPLTSAKKGKLILLLDGEPQGGKMPTTGLEELLTSNGVEVGDKRVLVATKQPSLVPAIPSEADLPITRAFAGFNLIVLPMESARRVSPGAAGKMKVEPLLVTHPEFWCWEESNLTADAKDLLNKHNRADNIGAFQKMLKRELPVAVAVSESSERIPMRGHVPVGDSSPRMVVFGSASWVSNGGIAMTGGNNGVDFFSSCVSWLRGKSDLGPDIAPPKDRPEFSLKKKGFDKGSKYTRLVWLPLGLMGLAILALGGGIWAIRRR